MSVADYFTGKCRDLLDENVSTLWKKLSNPTSFISFSATGSLVDAAKGGMGPLSSFAGDYMQKNAGGLAVEALQAAGLEDSVQNAFTLANNVMAAGLMANNEVIMFFVRNMAKGIIKDIDKKQEKLEEMTEALAALYNLLRVLAKGDPAYAEYLRRQRAALGHVVIARRDLLQVRNTFQARDRWLSLVFMNAKKELRLAQDLILPSQNNPGIMKAISGGDKVKAALKGNYNKGQIGGDPARAGGQEMLKGIGQVLGTLLEDTPIPTTDEQMQAIAAIPRASAIVLEAAQGYFEINGRINGKLKLFKAALSSLNSSLPGYFKSYILSLFDPALKQTDALVGSMAQTLNGSPTDFAFPKPGYKPKSSVVTVMGFKWAMDINLIFQTFKTIPEGALNALAISQSSVDTYARCVESIKRIGTLRSSDVFITINEGEEAMGDLETQLILFLLEANNAIISGSMRAGSLNVGTAMLRRLTMTSSYIGNLKSILQTFVDTPFELEEITTKAGEGLLKVFRDAGLDNAADALNDGNFNKFFKLSPKESTYAGAALITIAALKRCFPSDAARTSLSKTQFELEKAEDLLNIKFSLDFDLAILKNLSECARATALSNEFTKNETLCGLLPGGNIGKALAKIADVLSF